MARPLRLEFPGAIYHLTSHGNARQKVFFTDTDRQLFLDTLTGVVSRYSWICHAYCLMANHYHLLVETPKANLSLGMRQLNGIYTQAFNRRHRRVGHLFQGRFKAILVEKESYLLELCRYIVLNPVRVKGNLKTGSWKWSSYRATAGLAPAPGFLQTDWVLGQFGKKRAQAQKRYREFVKEGSESRPWEELKGQIYLGSKEFIERHSPRDQRLKEIPRAQLRAAKPSLERIFAKSGEQGIALAYKEHGYRLHEIAAHLGVHYATVSRRLKQTEQAE
ncbi:MAG TPA: transposase [Candidatus Binatia bacterium]|nr:transposase [Candidatus Binatia bacterium]